MTVRQRGGLSTVLVFGVVVLALLAGAILLLTSRPDPVQITILPPPPTATPPPLQIYVTGAVQNPQQRWSLPPGSRVADALTAAGGPLASADLTRINLAAPLLDGEQLHVPLIGEVLAPTDSAAGLLRINSATQADLETLPGVGPALAGRIIDYRTQSGRIENCEQLDEVSGIGPALLEQLCPLLRFD